MAAVLTDQLRARLDTARLELGWWNRRRLASIGTLMLALGWALFALIT